MWWSDSTSFFFLQLVLAARTDNRVDQMVISLVCTLYSSSRVIIHRSFYSETGAPTVWTKLCNPCCLACLYIETTYHINLVIACMHFRKSKKQTGKYLIDQSLSHHCCGFSFCCIQSANQSSVLCKTRNSKSFWYCEMIP